MAKRKGFNLSPWIFTGGEFLNAARLFFANWQDDGALIVYLNDPESPDFDEVADTRLFHSLEAWFIWRRMVALGHPATLAQLAA